MANISKRNRRREREIRNAAKNRREIIAARLSRRDLIKAGLLTSAGYLIQKNGFPGIPSLLGILRQAAKSDPDSIISIGLPECGRECGLIG